MKSDSHKGGNKKENALVLFYYTNRPFFIMLVFCSEICSVFLIVMNKSQAFYDSTLAWIVGAFLVANLTTKMIINVF